MRCINQSDGAYLKKDGTDGSICVELRCKLGYSGDPQWNVQGRDLKTDDKFTVNLRLFIDPLCKVLLKMIDSNL